MVGVITRKSRGVPYCAWLAIGASSDRNKSEKRISKTHGHQFCLVSEKWNREEAIAGGIMAQTPAGVQSAEG